MSAAGAAPSLDALYAQLVAHEGLRLKPYRDTAGKLTIGVGRNLDDVGISADEARALCLADIAAAEAALDARWPWWRGLDDSRRAVMADMAFNLGPAGLAGFRQMLSDVRGVRYSAASADMLASAWAGQVGGRAQTLARMMRTGEPFAAARRDGP